MRRALMGPVAAAALVAATGWIPVLAATAGVAQAAACGGAPGPYGHALTAAAAAARPRAIVASGRAVAQVKALCTQAVVATDGANLRWQLEPTALFTQGIPPAFRLALAPTMVAALENDAARVYGRYRQLLAARHLKATGDRALTGTWTVAVEVPQKGGEIAVLEFTFSDWRQLRGHWRYHLGALATGPSGGTLNAVCGLRGHPACTAARLGKTVWALLSEADTA
jgi:hypothetical protein